MTNEPKPTFSHFLALHDHQQTSLPPAQSQVTRISTQNRLNSNTTKLGNNQTRQIKPTQQNSSSSPTLHISYQPPYQLNIASNIADMIIIDSIPLITHALCMEIEKKTLKIRMPTSIAGKIIAVTRATPSRAENIQNERAANTNIQQS